MQSDNGKAEFKKYPKLFKKVCDSVQVFIETHPDSSARKKFRGSAYDIVFNNLFCDSYDEYVTKTSTDLWGGELDVKDFLQNYFNVKL